MNANDAKLSALLDTYPNTAEFLAAVQRACERLYADETELDTSAGFAALDAAVTAWECIES